MDISDNKYDCNIFSFFGQNNIKFLGLHSKEENDQSIFTLEFCYRGQRCYNNIWLCLLYYVCDDMQIEKMP